MFAGQPGIVYKYLLVIQSKFLHGLDLAYKYEVNSDREVQIKKKVTSNVVIPRVKNQSCIFNVKKYRSKWLKIKR